MKTGFDEITSTAVNSVMSIMKIMRITLQDTGRSTRLSITRNHYVRILIMRPNR